MNHEIRPAEPPDWPAVAAIFNHYVLHTFAAYTDSPVPETFFEERHRSAPGYPFLVAGPSEQLRGFACLAPLRPDPAFKQTATLTFFLHPRYTGQGLGTRFLEHLLHAGREMGLKTVLSNISSLNPGSIRFHQQRGFCECGRFREAGWKNGQHFDMVWMQRDL